MNDIASQHQPIRTELDRAISNVVDSGAFINGPQVKSFTKTLSEYLNVKEVIPCGNGTDALQISIMALGLKPGDEIISPSFTYAATAESVELLGLTIRFSDVDPKNFNLDPESLKKVISPKTKAVIAVHLFGKPANLEVISTICKENELYLIEDTAQALGGKYTFTNGDTKALGTIGDLGTTSFFPSKNLGCMGDGGAIFSNNPVLASKCRTIASHGQSQKYHHDIVGCNSRLDTIQAAVLDVKLPYLDGNNKKKQLIAQRYNELLESTPRLKTPNSKEHVFHQYTLRVSKYRDALKSRLNEDGIPSVVYYPIPLHKQKAFHPETHESLPVSELLAKEVLSLPMHPELEPETVNYICERINFHLNELVK